LIRSRSSEKELEDETRKAGGETGRIRKRKGTYAVVLYMNKSRARSQVRWYRSRTITPRSEKQEVTSTSCE
jgi:hypothetical protein